MEYLRFSLGEPVLVSNLDGSAAEELVVDDLEEDENNWFILLTRPKNSIDTFEYIGDEVAEPVVDA